MKTTIKKPLKKPLKKLRNMSIIGMCPFSDKTNKQKNSS